MKAHGIHLAALLCCLSAKAQEVVQPVLEAGAVERRFENRRSVSADGLITVYAVEHPVRSAVLNYVQSVRHDLLSLYLENQRTDDWKYPIVIEVHEPVPGQPVQPMRRQILQTAAGYRLQLDLWLASGLNREEVARRIVEFLVIENGLRAGEAEAGASWASPPWLTEGILEAIDWKNDRGDRELYEAVMKSNSGLGVDTLFQTEQLSELDPISLSEFRVWAGALVMSLVQSSPESREAFPAFLAEVGSFVGEPELLLGKHFPDMNISENSLKKWVVLKIATLSQAKTTDVLNVKETEEKLKEILTHAQSGKDGKVTSVSLWQHLESLEGEAQREIREIRVQQLLRLSYRCFPLMRPVVKDYIKLISRPAADPAMQQKALGELEDLRTRLIQDANRARDVLDWYELNAGNIAAGSLDDYLKLKDSVKSSQSDRRDGLSWYLDQIDRLRGGGEPAKE